MRLFQTFDQFLFQLFPNYRHSIQRNGTSLTISDVSKEEDWFEVWLIPETRRMTTFELKQAGSELNVEIERGTQVVVDTVRATLEEKLGPLLPALEALLRQNGVDINALASPPDPRQITGKQD
jgi:Riboflavin synthase alpha chain